MSISGISNLASLYAASSLNRASAKLQTVLEQLASGSSINSAADNPAGVSMVSEMQAQDTYLSQSQTNNAITEGSLQVASGALSQLSSLADQSVTLSTAAANGILTPAQENANNLQYQSLQAESANIANTTTYNGKSVFAADQSTLTGINQSLSSTDLSTAFDATSAVTAVNSAVSNLSELAGSYGTQINALNAASAVDSTEETNTIAALNAIQATDYAKAASEFAKEKTLYSIGVSLLA